MPKKIENIIESSWMKLFGGALRTLAVALLMWAGTTLQSIDKSMAVAMDKIETHDRRITLLENWRNDQRAGDFLVGEMNIEPHKN